MKRLRDMSDADPQLERAQQLLAQVAPLSHSNGDVQRLRRQLAARATPRRQRRGLLLLTALLVFVGSALAAAQNLGVLQLIDIGHSPAAEAEPSAPRTARRQPTVRSPAPPALDVALAPTAPSQILPAPVPTSQPDVRRKHLAQPTSEAELVRRALKALRRDGEPARAAQLLEQAYLRNPDGALAEEIMSLRVEAALARDDQRAAALARQYLARYPAGRYQAVALRALANKR